MPSAESLLSATPPKILLFGPPGGSKTVNAMTLGPRLELIDCDRGFASGVTTADTFQSTRRQVEVTPCHDTGPMIADGFMKAKNRILEISNACQRGIYKRQAVCLDSITTFGESCMKHFLIAAGRWGNGQAVQIQDYGAAVNYATQVLGILRTLPIPIICIAHDTMKLEGKQELTRVVTIGNKMSAILPSFFDEVWYAKANGANGVYSYVLQTKSSGTIMARSRRNLPDMTNTNIGMIEIIKKLGWEFPPLDPSIDPSVKKETQT